MRSPLALALGATVGLALLPATSVAAHLITGADIKNGSISSADIRDKSLTAKDFKPGQVSKSAPVSLWTVKLARFGSTPTVVKARTAIGPGETVQVEAMGATTGTLSNCSNYQIEVRLGDPSTVGSLARLVHDASGTESGLGQPLTVVAGSEPLEVLATCLPSTISQPSSATNATISIALRVTSAERPTVALH